MLRLIDVKKRVNFLNYYYVLHKIFQIKNNQELMAFVAPELDKQCKATKSAAEILYGVGNKEEGIQCQK